MNPETGFCTSGDGAKRLRTHVWHTKQFIMSKLWGFYLSFGSAGRDSLMSVLKMMMAPSPLALSEAISHSVISGSIYGSAMLALSCWSTCFPVNCSCDLYVAICLPGE